MVAGLLPGDVPNVSNQTSKANVPHALQMYMQLK